MTPGDPRKRQNGAERNKSIPPPQGPPATALFALVGNMAVRGSKPINGQPMMQTVWAAADGAQINLGFPIEAAEQIGRAIIDGAQELRLAAAGLHSAGQPKATG